MIRFLSAVLLILSYPPFGFWFLAWLAMVPFFISLSKAATDRQAFLRGYLFGIFFWLGTIWWIGYVTIFGAGMLVLYLSLYSGIFGWIFHRLWKKQIRGLRFILAVSILWTALEWVRSYLFTGFGWNLLAYSQAPNLVVIQIADLVGAFGVSFMMVWVNGAVFLICRGGPCARLLASRRSRGSAKPRARPIIQGTHKGCPYIWATCILTGFVFAYGFYRLNEKIPTQPISIAVIQGNVPQDVKWEEQYRSIILGRYEILTKTAALDHPELIIWPETSVVEDFSNPEIQNRIGGIARETDSFLLVGAPWLSSLESGGDIDGRYFNSAILFDSQGKLMQRYDKLHLVPYGEFIPFEKQFPFQRDWIVTGDFIGGKEHTVFEITGRGTLPCAPTFSVLICFEDIFPGLARQFVKNGARLLINISNDAWFHESGAAFQHAQASVFRAVENRVPVVRATNTGFSCFIDRWGRIQKEVPAFTTGHATATLQVQK